jgi:hypothetical protein
MTLQLSGMLKSQGWKVERESGTAYFYNHAPWVAPLAYLHILFKGATKRALSDNSALLRLPKYWLEFLTVQNGAILFSGAFSIYGVKETGALLNRRDVFQRGPFLIESENKSWQPKDRQREIVIGGYSYDGTLAVLDRDKGTVSAVSRKNHNLLMSWAGPDEWLTEEMDRLSKLFDKSGKITVGGERTLPG